MSLLGIVNYSDDDSSSDEAPVINTVAGNKKISKPSPVLMQKKPTTPLPQQSTPPAIETPTAVPAFIEQENKKDILKKSGTVPINDRKLRLLQVLTPKPIKDVKNWGIPDEPTTPCDPDRAAQIAHFLSLRRSGQRLNEHLQRNKSFRNPRIYAKLVEFTEVDEFGSNFEDNQFDFPKEMYIDGILETQKRLAEEKAASQQNRSSVQFVSSTTGLTQQQSSAMAQAMATAAKVASRIAKPPPQLPSTPPVPPTTTTNNNDMVEDSSRSSGSSNGKRRKERDDDRRSHKKRHHY